jgi:hypothetical protein
VKGLRQEKGNDLLQADRGMGAEATRTGEVRGVDIFTDTSTHSIYQYTLLHPLQLEESTMPCIVVRVV